jgi:hypothetical protein
MFLKPDNSDYWNIINPIEFNQLLKGNPQIDLTFQETQAIQFVASQISQRYKTDMIFEAFQVFNLSNTYYPNDRVYTASTSGNTYYYNINSSTTGITNIDITDSSTWKLGDNRNLVLVKYILDIVIYNIMKTCNYRNQQDLRIQSYNEAIAFFNLIAEGKRNIDLPEVDAKNQEGYALRWGSDKPRTNNFFWS